MLLILLWLAAAAGAGGQAVVAGRAVDAETGRPVPATITIRASDGSIVAGHPSFRGGFRSPGEFAERVPAGETVITVSRGCDFVAVRETAVLREGERREFVFPLRRRSPLRREGWYAGDHHAHMVHGERLIAVDFPYVALAARAEGLDYLALAQHWNLDPATPEALDRACRQVSGPDFVLTWNLEAPKNYYRGDVSRCLGHGWTAGMAGRTAGAADAIRELLDLSAHDYESEKEPAPNFESHALIHSLGGVVSYSHPCRWWWGKWGGRGGYPVEEKKYVSNMAAELPFDTVAGPTYDTIDVLMPPQEREANACAEKLWFLLLDHGYRLPATGSSDATFDRPGGGLPGRVRVYTRLEGGLSTAAVAEALRAGRSFVTTGPLITLEIDGRMSGDVLPLAGQRYLKVRIRAWAAGTYGAALKRVELIRNGALVRSFNVPDSRTEFETAFGIEETRRAWYIARCFGADDSQVAIANPVYLEPPDFQPPPPALAEIEATVTDEESGEPLSGAWDILRRVGKREAPEQSGEFSNGRFRLRAPATARLRVRVPDYAPATRSVFLDYAPLLETTFALQAGQLTGWATFEKFRELLGSVRLAIALHRAER